MNYITNDRSKLIVPQRHCLNAPNFFTFTGVTNVAGVLALISANYTVTLLMLL